MNAALVITGCALAPSAAVGLAICAAELRAKHRRARLVRELSTQAAEPLIATTTAASLTGSLVLDRLDAYRRLRDVACTHTSGGQCPVCGPWVESFDLMCRRMLTGRITPIQHRPDCTRDEA